MGLSDKKGLELLLDTQLSSLTMKYVWMEKILKFPNDFNLLLSELVLRNLYFLINFLVNFGAWQENKQ